MISLIVAHDPNRVIGLNGQMPWHIPEDLAYFKKQTLHKPVIMGRKTFDSIGKPLPNRENIVVTRNPEWAHDGVQVFRDFKKAVDYAKSKYDETMIIGGEQIFRLALPMADRLYITFVQQNFVGDTYFPAYGYDWILVSTSSTYFSEEGFPYSFLIYEKEPVC